MDGISLCLIYWNIAMLSWQTYWVSVSLWLPTANRHTGFTSKPRRNVIRVTDLRTEMWTRDLRNMKQKRNACYYFVRNLWHNFLKRRALVWSLKHWPDYWLGRNSSVGRTTAEIVCRVWRYRDWKLTNHKNLTALSTGLCAFRTVVQNTSTAIMACLEYFTFKNIWLFMTGIFECHLSILL